MYKERVVRYVLLALIILGCGKGASREPVGQGSGAGTGSAPALQANAVELVIDGERRPPIVVTGMVSLATLVPTTPPWLHVEAAADDGRYIEVASLATTYPGGEIRLSLRNGRVAVGVYRAAVTDVPAEIAAIAAQPVIELTNVTKIEVLTRPLPVKAEATLAIEISGKPPRALEIDDLKTLSEHRERRVHGWLLRDVIGLASATVAVASVKVVGEDGETTVTSSELAGLSLLKRNQRGQLVFQMYDGSAERAQRQVRGVTKLVVVPK